jgi:hypothetical protein
MLLGREIETAKRIMAFESFSSGRNTHGIVGESEQEGECMIFDHKVTKHRVKYPSRQQASCFTEAV